MALTLQQRLEAVRDAIDAITTGAQSYTIFGRTVTRANITELEKLEARYERKLAAQSGTGTNYAQFDQ